ncbi:MAG: hypothetical protein ACRD0P_11920, partial [Stackebrandtia sp.]
MVRPDDGGGQTQEESNQYYAGEIEDFIDLCTDKYIQFDEGGDIYNGGHSQYVYTDDNAPWEWLAGSVGGHSGSPAEAKQYYLEAGRAAGDSENPPSGSAVETSDERIIIQRAGAGMKPDIWYKRKGAAWMARRPMFEGVKDTFNTALSYKQDGLFGPQIHMEYAYEDLVPKGDINADEVGELSKVN